MTGYNLEDFFHNKIGFVSPARRYEETVALSPRM